MTDAEEWLIHVDTSEDSLVSFIQLFNQKCTPIVVDSGD